MLNSEVVHPQMTHAHFLLSANIVIRKRIIAFIRNYTRKRGWFLKPIKENIKNKTAGKPKFKKSINKKSAYS